MTKESKAIFDRVAKEYLDKINKDLYGAAEREEDSYIVYETEDEEEPEDLYDEDDGCDSYSEYRRWYATEYRDLPRNLKGY